MGRNTIKRIRTALQALVAAALVVTAIDLGPLIDALKAVGFDTTGLGVVDPATAAAIVALLGIVAGAVTAVHQWLDKTRIPSLAVPPAPAFIPEDAATPSHLTDAEATED